MRKGTMNIGNLFNDLAIKERSWGWMKSVVEDYLFFLRWKNLSIFNVKENRGINERIKYTKIIYNLEVYASRFKI